MTASHSSADMFTSMRSRRMPALLTRTWRSPKVSTAWSTRCLAPSQSATSSKLAMAEPPASAISFTTCCAGDVSAPVPSGLPPRSFTTTLAPSDANSSACSRPMPRPAPVTIATRPFSSFMVAPPPSGTLRSVSECTCARTDDVRVGRCDTNGSAGPAEPHAHNPERSGTCSPIGGGTTRQEECHGTSARRRNRIRDGVAGVPRQRRGDGRPLRPRRATAQVQGPHRHGRRDRACRGLHGRGQPGRRRRGAPRSRSCSPPATSSNSGTCVL